MSREAPFPSHHVASRVRHISNSTIKYFCLSITIASAAGASHPSALPNTGRRENPGAIFDESSVVLAHDKSSLVLYCATKYERIRLIFSQRVFKRENAYARKREITYTIRASSVCNPRWSSREEREAKGGGGGHSLGES